MTMTTTTTANTFTLADIPALVEVTRSTGRALMLSGAPGLGKSAIVEGVVPATLETLTGHEHPVVTVNLGLLPDAVEVNGYQIPGKDSETGNPTTFRAEPEILRRVRKTGASHGVLFLDELAQAAPDVQKAVCSLVYERRIGDYHLPAGWQIIAAGNRAADRAGSGRLLSILRDRMKVVAVEFDGEQWASWASGQSDIDPELAAFVLARPNVVAREVPREDVAFCSPRSLAVALRELSATPYRDGVAEFTRKSIEAEIGAPATVELLAYASTLGLLPTIREILANPKTATIPPNDRLDARFATVQMLVEASTGENAGRLLGYAKRLPQEFQAGFAFALTRKLGSKLDTISDYAEWLAANFPQLKSAATQL